MIDWLREQRAREHDGSWAAAVCVVTVIAAATVAQMIEQDEPMLVEVPCSQQRIEAGVEKCYDAAIEGASQLEEFTLMCNSVSAANEEKLRAKAAKHNYCGPDVPDIPDDVPDIPEDQEWAAGIRPLPDQVQP
jgi:hypothetical protein